MFTNLLSNLMPQSFPCCNNPREIFPTKIPLLFAQRVPYIVDSQANLKSLVIFLVHISGISQPCWISYPCPILSKAFKQYSQNSGQKGRKIPCVSLIFGPGVPFLAFSICSFNLQCRHCHQPAVLCLARDFHCERSEFFFETYISFSTSITYNNNVVVFLLHLTQMK